MNTHAKRIPLYQTVEQALRQRIQSGEWSPEAVFPSRREICETYEVSGITAIRVLESLEKVGLIERVQGRGNFFRGSWSRATATSALLTGTTDLGIIAPRRGSPSKNLFMKRGFCDSCGATCGCGSGPLWV